MTKELALASLPTGSIDAYISAAYQIPMLEFRGTPVGIPQISGVQVEYDPEAAAQARDWLRIVRHFWNHVRDTSLSP